MKMIGLSLGFALATDAANSNPTATNATTFEADTSLFFIVFSPVSC
jgi:hypothetical protein